MGTFTMSDVVAGVVATPASNEYTLYFDAADGVLKFKDSGGTVHVLGGGIPATLIDALGDLIYGSADNTPAILSGNTSAVRKFLRQLGTGSVSAAPAWDTIAEADLPLPAWVALTDGATITWDVASKREAKGSVTLGGNRTLSITNAANGSAGLLRVTQDGTGSRTLTLPTGSLIVGGGGTSPTLSTAAGAVDLLAFEYDGTNYWWTIGKGAA